ncbi:MAG: DNA-3-methyladenine glycosylase 2 family protein [Acidobacteriaceae bacterium]|nr:DNA-3-methyladenine glycosylase 2 family protein [Acidobacteriaceae bacterium]
MAERVHARRATPSYRSADALAHLSAHDAKLRVLIERAGPFRMKIAPRQSPFEALVEAIIYQQIHGKAAASIHARFLESFSPLCGLGVHPSPEHLLDCPNEQLRTAGLSHNKALALRDLAAKTLDGTVPALARIRRMDDETVIEHLTQVRGIGRWTVEMMLMFRLGRPNVLPVSDYGIRKGFALTFLGLNPEEKVTSSNLATAAQITARARRCGWSPWSTVASWYLWRACDLAAGKAVQPE